MSATAAENSPAETGVPTPWSGPGAAHRGLRARWQTWSWRRLLWAFVWPRCSRRIVPTVSGTLLIAVALGLGSAAYNTANNILFIALSLLLACLIGSGVLSALNFAKVSWRLVPTAPYRAGHPGTLAIEVRNRKRLLPTHGLWFELRLDHATGGPLRRPLPGRLDPGGAVVRIECTWQPPHRGIAAAELVTVGSLFPFGFLRKAFNCEQRATVLVWPAPVEYQTHAVLAPQPRRRGRSVARAGASGDLYSVRKYASGDSHRQIHWKASARLRQWLVRQDSAEQLDRYSLRFDTAQVRWPRAAQFELACSLVASLAEDLFTAGRLGTVALDREPPRAVRSVRDLEAFLDAIARATPSASPSAAQAISGATDSNPRLALTFSPDGARGVAAFVDGQRAASA